MKELNNEDKLLQNVKRIHMIGIGGSGMCPIAEILHTKGYELTGSDNNESDPLDRVKKFATVYMGHDGKNVEGADLVIYSAAINKNNPELIRAHELGIPTMERSHCLGALTRMYDKVIGVCGTHGKTTVTSLITQILIQTGQKPNSVIGGKLPLIDHYGITGDSELMVVESCEYVDTFLQLSEDVAVLLNIDNDHLEYFKTMDNLTESFHRFISKAKLVYINGDDFRCRKAAENIKGQIVTFGFEKTNDFYPENITSGKYGNAFDVYFKGARVTNVQMSIPGHHNILNALAGFAVAYQLGLDAKEIADSINQFKGAGRRFEFLGDYGFILADDYGHHPTEIEATLKAAKQLDYERVICIFQPFTFSRTAMLKQDFARVLTIADKCILTPIMGSREVNTYNIYSEDIKNLMPENYDCEIINSFEEIAKYIILNAKKGDLVITMGCGDVYKIAHIIQNHFKK